ncbi:MAG TPA: enoyl-ACP reductase [Candidatus Kapabacteria bacterium]|nr:enoyl-ACP reductase [Candidatus Kapabacteria bacterium]
MPYGLLNGKRGIVFGPLDQSSLGWHIALQAYSEGAELIISNAPIALRMGKPQQLAKMCGDALLIPCDASEQAEIDSCFKTIKEQVGKIDFIVHAIGMSGNIRKGVPYAELNYDWYHRTIDVSGLSLHRIISSALAHEVLNHGASILALSFLAAQRSFSTYTDMAEAKAVLESIARNYGSRLGSKGIRVNTVSQSPTKTRAGSNIEDFDKLYRFADLLAPLGNPSAEECGEYCVTLLSDLTRKVTMQNLLHDGGYSNMGMTQPMLRLMMSSMNEADLRSAGFDQETIDRVMTDLEQAEKLAAEER